VTTSETKQTNGERLPWEKPVLRSISLVTDQVLGTACKAELSNPSTNKDSEPLGCLNKTCALELGS
jgi:hypothetical protein